MFLQIPRDARAVRKRICLSIPKVTRVIMAVIGSITSISDAEAWRLDRLIVIEHLITVHDDAICLGLLGHFTIKPLFEAENFLRERKS